ncbi:MAG: hypothetical protein NZ805_05130 [Armatimonadetes bacterium]|nr:hypothetical protein [Armatimonadota bacterium]MDW8026809.1 hypothetical protein [Armatimonadota bacterium]
MGGIIGFPDGRLISLSSVTDSDLSEQWLRRTVKPMALWSLTTPMLPVGENLTTPFGTIVPILGLDGEGRTIAILFDLRTERPLPTILGEGITALQWAESLDEKQLEAFGRYFWHDPKASLAVVWSQAHNVQERTVSFGVQSQVHILSLRPKPVLWNVQYFLHRYGLAIFFFGLHTLQGEQGEMVAIAEPVMVPLATKGAVTGLPVHHFGNVEDFLKFLEATGNT